MVVKVNKYKRRDGTKVVSHTRSDVESDMKFKAGDKVKKKSAGKKKDSSLKAMAKSSKPDMPVDKLRAIAMNNGVDADMFVKFWSIRFPKIYDEAYADEWASRISRGRHWALADKQSREALLKAGFKIKPCDFDDLPKDNSVVAEYHRVTAGKAEALLLYPSEGDTDNPREWDNLGIMFCSHRRYDLGDEQFRADEFGGWDEVADYLINERGAIKEYLYPLYLYDHSGLRIKIGSFAGLLPQGHAEFDSGMVGFIYTTEEKLKMMGTPRNRIKAVLEGEVQEYDDYVSGNVYWAKQWVCVDGLWTEDETLGGLYGSYLDDAIESNFGKGWKRAD